MTTTGLMPSRRDGLARTLLSHHLPEVAATLRLPRWWRPKATNLLTVLYSVMLFVRLPFPRATLLTVPSIVTILGIGAFGHVINDLCDIGNDRIAGKANRMAGLDSRKRYGLVLGLLCIALLPWVVLPFDSLSLALLFLEFALLLAYAVPPFRLKRRRIWAVLADSAYAYVIPAILAAHTFFLAGTRPDNRILLLSLVFWQLGLGARHYLNHLALDRVSDLTTGIETLATEMGNRSIHSLIRHLVLPIELGGFLAYLLVMSTYLRLLVWIVVGLLLFSSAFHIVLTVGRSYPLLTYRFSRTQLDWLYQDIFPLILVTYLLLADWRYCPLLLLHLALFPVKRDCLNLAVLGWPFILLWQHSKCQVRRFLSPSIDADAESVLDRGNSRAQPASSQKCPGRMNIAVVNIHKDKYTETFVHGLISRLHYNVYYLYGGELPRYDDEGRHFLSSLSSLQSLAPFLEAALGLEKHQLLKHSIASYLQARHIRLVLAEFGPVGSEMIAITRDLGIPLVVCFHGYDAFNQQTLKQCTPQYACLFRDAARVIAVSEKMRERLQQLGAPQDKLVHLPAFVDLELFPYSDHSTATPGFLAVGRFAETKSPHLTILAFHKVVQVIPQARLTMIGKGGGGELFEACLILVRALGLEHCVEFKGAVPHEEVAIAMRGARVFVQHSVTTPENSDMEGKPVAVAEAMACGLPVVATRHSGLLELIEHEVTGLLVAEYDVAAMAAAMIRLAQDDDLVRRLGRAASVAIHGHPLIKDHVRILEEIIEQSIASA
jgi:colanic acid/amylovoran biosynthesis glycosyltransferase